MKSATELYEEWTSGDSSGVRPARVKELRNALREHTDRTVPRRLSEIEGWLEAMKGQITKELKDSMEEEKAAEDATEDDGDGEDE